MTIESKGESLLPIRRPLFARRERAEIRGEGFLSGRTGANGSGPLPLGVKSRKFSSGRDTHPRKTAPFHIPSRKIRDECVRLFSIFSAIYIEDEIRRQDFRTIRRRKYLLPRRGAHGEPWCATRKPEPNSRAIMGRNRGTIYYAPLDHHLNANPLITTGANCYVLARSFARL